MSIQATEGVKSEKGTKKPIYDFDYVKEQAMQKAGHIMGQLGGYLNGQITPPGAAPTPPSNTSACGFSA